MKNFLLASLLLAACGGDDTKNQPVDATQANDVTTPDGSVPAKQTAYIVAGDFKAGDPGTMAMIAVDDKTVTKNAAPAGAVGDDTVLRKYGNELFIVNRADGNNVTILKASDHTLVEQLSTGTGSNPQDVAVVGNKLYVPTLAGKGVVVLTRGTSTTKTIDLSADDPDGNPDCVSAYAVGSKVYVACGLLDASFSPRGNGKIYVIDTASDTKTGSSELSSPNPIGLFERAPNDSALAGDLVIPTVSFADGSGCVEQVALDGTGKGCLVHNSDLPGYVSRVDFQTLPDTSNIMLMAVAHSDFTHASLWGYDIAGATLWSNALTPSTQIVGDVAACPNNTFVIADKNKSGANGVRIYVNNHEVTTAPLDIGIDPEAQHGLVCY